MNINNNMYPDKIQDIFSLCSSVTKNNGFRTGYEDLGDEIVIRALIDYYYTLRRLKKNPHDHKAQKQRQELLEFFSSDWCEILSSFNVERCISILEKRV